MENSNFTRFLEGLVRTSWQAGVLALVIVAVQSLLRRRLTPRWRCSLWLLLVARLLLPVSYGSALSIFNLLPRWHVPSEGLSEAIGRPPIPPPAPETARAVPAVSRQAPANLPEPPSFDPSAPPVNPEPPMIAPAALPTPAARVAPIPRRTVSEPASCLFWIWLAGALLFAGYVAASSFRLARSLSPLRPLTDPSVAALLAECRSLMKIQTSPQIVDSGALAGPGLYGLIHPRLALPAGFHERFSAAELRFVFLHELAHLKRRDLAMNWLVAALQAIHWFNPLVWLGFARWRLDRELACDAMALDAAGPNQGAAYGRTILRLVAGFTPPAPGMIGILESKRQLRLRIGMIAAPVPARRWPILAATAAVAIAAVGLTDARNQVSASTQNIVGRTGGGGVLFHLHFAGEEVFSTATNFARLRRLVDLTNSVKIQRGALQRLARMTAEILQAGTTTAAQASRLEPLWEDAARFESVAEWRQSGPDATEMIFLIKPPGDHLPMWSDRLRESFSQWRPGRVKAGDRGWQVGLDNGATLKFSQEGEWVALAVGKADTTVGREMVRRARAGRPPEDFATPFEWLTADVNWPELQRWLPHPLGPFKAARMLVSARMTNDNVRTSISLRYPRDIGWEGENWTPPTEIIGWPVVSLTGTHHLGALLEKLPSLERLGYNPFAGDLYFWAEPDTHFQTFVLAKVGQAAAALRDLGGKAPQVLNPALRERNWGEIYWTTNKFTNVTAVTNANRPHQNRITWQTNTSSEEALRLRGLPAITPMLTATNDAGAQYLYGSLFPAFSMGLSFPPGLASQLGGQTDLVYYDWEITVWRLDQWKVLRNILPLFAAVAPAAPGEPAPPALMKTDETLERLTLEEQWFAEIMNSKVLGEPVNGPRERTEYGITSLKNVIAPRESVTELRRVSPREFSMTRKSGCGLTAVELVYLAHWLTDPAFPRTGGSSDAGSPQLRPPGLK